MTELETLPSRNGLPETPGDRPPSTLSMLALGVERGFNPEQLEKLLALHERVEKARAVEAFNAAMRDCQAEMPIVVRGAKNAQTNSRYARLEDLNETCKPVYTHHGFALSFGETDAPLPGWKRTICDVRHVGGHEVQYHVDLPLDGVGAKGNAIGAMNPVQAAISTATYGQRALTARIFNVTIADTDRDGSSGALLECLSDDELDKVRTLIVGKNVDQDRFLKLVSEAAKTKIESLERIPRGLYGRSMAWLRSVRGS